MKRFKLVFMIYAALVFFGIIGIYASCERIEREEKVEVKAIVTEKKYEKSYTSYVPRVIGKVNMMVPQVHKARYLVTIGYEGLSETFDNKKLYESFKEGDNINVILHSYYHANDNTIDQRLEILDNKNR